MSKDIKFNFLNSDEEERYQKHLTLKEIGYEGQLNLKNSSVLCIGAGGLGSSVLLYLAATGIGRIGIVDNDKVEKSNLQRQIIHETNTIGNQKIDSAKERIKKLNPNCEILTFSERINPKNALELINEFDVICDCSDNFGTRYLINDSCLILNKPLVFGSVQGFEGQVSVFNLFKNSPNLRDLLPESPSKNAAPSCSEYGIVGVSTGLIGILQVNEIIKIILKKGETLIDTAMTLNAMHPDIIVIRHQDSGACNLLSQKVNCAVLNAGDGRREHPTQALLDALTIINRRKKIEGLKIAICGDILHSRVARSNIYLLNMLGAEVNIVAPTNLMPNEIERFGVNIFSDMKKGVKDCDIVMMLRLQNERMTSSFLSSNREYYEYYGLTPDKIKFAKEDALIMHPGPMNRGIEIDTNLADDINKSVIKEQVELGVAVRMACLKIFCE